MQRALISVSDKRGIVPFARELVRTGWQIVSTGGVPAAWREEAGAPPYLPETRRRLLRKLDDLIRSFERAPVFDSEETRRVLLADLRASRERWARGEWEALETERAEPIPPSSSAC